jgi:hypothetical protein
MTPARWLYNKRLDRAERKLWLAMRDADKDMRAKALDRRLDRLRRELIRQGGQYNLMLYKETYRYYPDG